MGWHKCTGNAYGLDIEASPLLYPCEREELAGVQSMSHVNSLNTVARQEPGGGPLSAGRHGTFGMNLFRSAANNKSRLRKGLVIPT